MSFECLEKCGKCCGIIPLSKEVVERNKDKFAVVPREIKDVITNVFVMTHDGACVFLDRDTKRCNIYEDRPQLCRDFGLGGHVLLECPYLLPSGAPRSDEDKKELADKISQASKEVEEMLGDLGRND